MRDQINLKVSSPALSGNVIESILDSSREALTKGLLSKGPWLDRLENGILSSGLLEVDGVTPRHGVKAACFSSWTTGMTAVLQALSRDDDLVVVLPAFTFAGTFTPINAVNAKYVFVDSGVSDPSMSINSLRRALVVARSVPTERPRQVIIMPVDVYGCPVSLSEVAELRDTLVPDALIITDSAQSFGHPYARYRPGAEAIDVEVYSMSATKPVTAGEGGIVVFRTNGVLGPRAIDLYQQVVSIRNYGVHTNSEGGQEFGWLVGMNGRMPELSAIVGYHSLQEARETHLRRQQLCHDYFELLADAAFYNPIEDAYTTFDMWTHTCCYMPVKLDPSICRKTVIRRLDNVGIEVRPYFSPSLPLALDRSISKRKPYAHERNLRANLLGETVLCLPLHTGVDPSQVQWIVNQLDDAVRRSPKKEQL